MIQLNGEILTLIDETAKKTAEQTTIELKRQNLIVKGKQTPFQKTETLLYNVPHFKKAIKDKEDQIKEIREIGLRGKSKSITTFSGNSGLLEVKSEAEKAEEKIEMIEFSIATTRRFIKIIEDAVASLRDDDYYELIALRYFEGKTQEQIAEFFDRDVSTVNRNKNRLINLLQIRLFSDEVIQYIFMS